MKPPRKIPLLERGKVLKITISGASGFIGGRLLKALLQEGHSVHVLGRQARTNFQTGVRMSVWNNPVQNPPPEESLYDADAVIHLAGEPVAQRWTKASKRRILESREAATRNLVQAISKLSRKPKILICASAIGYYGDRGDEILTETSSPGAGFLADVCLAWEREAQVAESLGMRVVRMRTGIVLGFHGGALQRMLPLFRLGIGGRLGGGKQWMSWIHLEDLVALYRFALTDEIQGAVNGVAPNSVTNAEFTRILASTLRRPAIFPVPKMALRFLFGEMAEMLFDSQRVLPAQAEAAGFQFQFPHLGQALNHLLNR